MKTFSRINKEGKDMKEKVFEAGTFNGWRGVIGLYFTRKELAQIKREIKAKGHKIKDIEDLTIKQVYNLL